MINKKYHKTLLSVLVACAAGSLNAATYKVTELSQFAEYRQHFGLDINEQGDIIGVARDSFNFPIYMEEYITSDTGYFKSFADISEDEITSGSLDAVSTAAVKSELARTSGSTGRPTFAGDARFQKIGDSRAFLFSGGNGNLVNLTDEVETELGEFTRSTIEQLNAINDNGLAVGTGSAPYLPIEFQQSGEDAAEDPVKFWVREYQNRAVIYVNGNVSFLEPTENAYGGVSSATGVSNTGFISGYESVAVLESGQTDIDECDKNLAPESVCAWTEINAGTLFTLRPVVWQVDGSGNLLNKVNYPLAFTPTEEQTANYVALATSVNDDGVAVGYGAVQNTRYDAFELMPTYFKDGETHTILQNNDNYDRGFSTDINNSNVLVGTLQKRIASGSSSNSFEEQFFVYDIDAGELSTPQAFFSSSQSVANAVNDNGMVIGEAEYEITTSSVRRKHGFIYSMESKELFDINDLTECGSQYNIVEMKGINNQNQIVATALKLVDGRDAHGEIFKDDDGNTVNEEIAVTVLLDPIANGVVEECGDIENPKYSRQGFSFGATMGLLLSGLVALRRRFL